MPEKKKMTIKVKDKEYPCYPTMGAAVRFKDQTGRDMEEMKGASDFAVYVYCCVMSAYNREHGKQLDMSLQDFCDGILIEDVNALNEEMAAASGVTADNGGDAKKN